jgi:23S rRNA (guanine745-N1)-methyltransferase
MGLADVVGDLRCPHGEPTLALADTALVCPAGHRFDVARQGYVNLLVGPAPAAADTADMVAARERVQAAGHHDAITAGIVAAVRAAAPGGIDATVVDVGAGTGRHLAAVLDATDAPAGLAVDLSKHAARRAARAHDRIGAVVADAWRRLPVRSATAAAVLVAFAPRRIAELRRILRPDGLLVVVSPTPDHLEPLVTELGLLRIPPGKDRALDAALAGVAEPVGRHTVEDVRHLTPDEALAMVAMGPSAHHRDPDELRHAIAGLPAPLPVRLSATVRAYRVGRDGGDGPGGGGSDGRGGSDGGGGSDGRGGSDGGGGPEQG